MTTAAEYIALAERCEREEPSRELDVEIALALGWQPEPDRDWNFWIDPTTPDRFRLLRHYTTRLDDALTLVSADVTAWRVGKGSIAWAVVATGSYGAKNYVAHTAQARTPEGALCAAALRARAAMVPA